MQKEVASKKSTIDVTPPKKSSPSFFQQASPLKLYYVHIYISQRCFPDTSRKMVHVYGLEVQPLLAVVTVVSLVAYLLTHFVDRSKTADWIAKFISKDKELLKTLESLSKERREVESERNKLSAQDNYAKWTKLNRKLDKLNDQITELSKQISSNKAAQSGTIKSIIMFIQKAPTYIIRFWYSRTPVIMLFSDKSIPIEIFTVPFPFSWALCMPWGKKNTISSFFWCMAIETVLDTFYNFYTDVQEYVSLCKAPVQADPEKKTA